MPCATAEIGARPLGGAEKIAGDPRLARLALVCGSGLAATDPFAAWSPADAEWRSFADQVARQRAWGLVAAADGARIKLAPEQRREVLRRLREAMAATLVVERATIEVVRLLESSGIESRVLKGPASARFAYRSASMRPFSDVDLLVRSAEFDHATAVIERAGAVRHSTERVGGSIAAVGKGVGLRLPGGVEVDLHRRLAQGLHQFGTREDVLFDRPRKLVLGGERLLAVSDEVAFVNACLHAVTASDQRRVVPLRDVAQYQRLVRSTDTCTRIARELRAEGAVATAIVAAQILLGAGDDPVGLAAWARNRSVSRVDRWWLAIASRDQRLPRPMMFAAAVAAQPSPAAAGRYIHLQIRGRGPNRRRPVSAR